LDFDPADLTHVSTGFLTLTVRDTDGLRANGGLLVLLNLLAHLAPPLDAGDALSAQIARIVGEIVPWLFPPLGLRVRVVPAVRDSLADALAFVCALMDGQMHANKLPGVRVRTPSSRRSRLVAAGEQCAGPERAAAFAKLVEELRALAVFVFDEPQHAPRS